MIENEKLKKLFKQYNLKITKQREYVINLVSELGDNATAKTIASKCTGIADYSTVYRIIDLFLEKSLFEKGINYNNEIYFSIKEEHGHYITCIKCHKKEKIEECPLDEIEKGLANEGYKVLSHTIQLDGICKKCLINNQEV